MTAVRSYRDLIAWQRGMDLALATYELTRSLPREEVYGLTAQIRRASVSIPSNIAEGHNHGSTAIFLRHLGIALGSQAELETQLELAVRLGFITGQSAEHVRLIAEEVGKVLHGLVRALQQPASEA